jgi:hypothetical protein
VRNGIFVAVLVAHLVIVLVLSFHAPQQHIGETSPTMSALLLEDRKIEESFPASPTLRNITPHLPEGLAPLMLEEGTGPPTSSSSALTDFSSSAHEVAEEISRREGSQPFRSLDRQIQAASAQKRPLQLFSAPQHAPNTTEHFDDGSDRHYVSSTCFYDFDRQPSVSPDLQAGPKLKVPTCKSPSESGNQDMFKNLAGATTDASP